MNKILKTSLTILGILFFCILLKSGVKFYNIIGVVGLYGSVYYFMTLNSEGIENFYLKEIMTVLISYNLQKMGYILHREVYKNKLFLYTNIIMICFFCILFVYNLFRNKKISLKNILDLGYEFLIISIPFYIIKGRGMQPIILTSIITIIKIFLKKEYRLDKDIKKIYISIVSLILFSTTSFIGNSMTKVQIGHYQTFVMNLIFLLIFIQLQYSKLELKKLKAVFLTSSILPIIPIITELYKVQNLHVRLGYLNANRWATEAMPWAVIYLYILFFKKRYEYILIYLFYILGVIISGSRGAMVAVILASLGMIIYRYKSQTKMLLITFLCTIVIFIGILNTNNRIAYTINLIKNEKKLDNSSKIRLIIYKEAFDQFKIKPINGLGFSGYQSNAIKRHLEENTKELNELEKIAYSIYHAHNNILSFLCSTGILGALSYILMNFFICKKGYKIFAKGGILILSLIFSYELFGLMEETIYHMETQVFLYLIIGILFSETTPKINFLKKDKLK